MRVYDVGLNFTVPSGQADSNEIIGHLSDADEFLVSAPAGIEADFRIQLWDGVAWVDYDAVAFTASAYRMIQNRGLKHRIHKVAATAAADRVFQVLKRVGNT